MTPSKSPSAGPGYVATATSYVAGGLSSTWSYVSGMFSKSSRPPAPSTAISAPLSQQMPHIAYQDLSGTQDLDEPETPQQYSLDDAEAEAEEPTAPKEDEVPPEIAAALQDKYVRMCAPEKYQRYAKVEAKLEKTRDPLKNAKIKIPKPLLESVGATEKEIKLAQAPSEGYLDYCDEETSVETVALPDDGFDAAFPLALPNKEDLVPLDQGKSTLKTQHKPLTVDASKFSAQTSPVQPSKPADIEWFAPETHKETTNVIPEPTRIVEQHAVEWPPRIAKPAITTPVITVVEPKAITVVPTTSDWADFGEFQEAPDFYQPVHPVERPPSS